MTSNLALEPLVPSGMASTFAWLFAVAFWVLAAFVGAMLGHVTITTVEGTGSIRSRVAEQALFSVVAVGGFVALVYLVGVGLPIPAAAVGLISVALTACAFIIYRAAFRNALTPTAGPKPDQLPRTSDR